MTNPRDLAGKAEEEGEAGTQINRQTKTPGYSLYPRAVPPTAGFFTLSLAQHAFHRLVGLVVKASASRAEDPEFESRLRGDFSGSSHTSDLKNWHSSGCPARRLALKGQRWDWLARCQYTVTGWDGKFDLQLLSQCGSTCNCLSRSVPEIH